ncbi:5'-nucleotidase C-terminal domain-containing protein [Alteromonadaceae bacterium BrNp21-10]|nr:5'-nucleotidase C-terminal domain-containing protein [Alteromonadaceae bacterium BrNp21-10]
MNNIEHTDEGSYPELATLLKEYRQQPQPTFFIFGGGSLGPSSLASFDRGAHIIDILNTLEPNALGVAKREFSFHEDELSLRAYEAAFPVVASNIYDPLNLGQLDGLATTAVLQQGNIKIGFISVLDKSVVSEYALKRVQISSSQQAIEKYAQQLRQQQVDLIVVHYSNPLAVIDNLLTEGIIDIAMRKDEHFHLLEIAKRPSHPNNIFLTEATNVAVIDIKISNTPPKLSVDWHIKSLNNMTKDPAVNHQVLKYSAHLSKLLDEQIGTLTTELDTTRLNVRTQENPLGNFITDALKSFSGADIAIINGGTIRGEAHYDANHILTRRDIAKELPFRNRVVVMEVTGGQIIQALESGLSQIQDVKGRFPQVSGLEVTYAADHPPYERVTAVKVNHQPIDTDKLYKLATSDYIAGGGDGYAVFKQSKKLNYNNQMTRLIADIVIDTIRRQKIISPKLEARLVNSNATVDPMDD